MKYSERYNDHPPKTPYSIFDLLAVEYYFHNRVRRLIYPTLKKNNLSYLQWLVLYYIYSNSGSWCDSTKINDFLKIKTSNISVILKALNYLGLIAIEVHYESIRSKELRITKNGKLLCISTHKKIETLLKKDPRINIFTSFLN